MGHDKKARLLLAITLGRGFQRQTARGEMFDRALTSPGGAGEEYHRLEGGAVIRRCGAFDAAVNAGGAEAVRQAQTQCRSFAGRRRG